MFDKCSRPMFPLIAAVMLCASSLPLTGQSRQMPDNRVSLRGYEWTRHYDWIRDFEYERRLVANYEGFQPPYMVLPAYTQAMTEGFVRSLVEAGLPWVMPTSSADENMVLGKSAGWPEGKALPWPENNPISAPQIPGWETLDPAVPPQNIYGFTITDPQADGEKIKVILAAGNHPMEFNGNWALHAMVDFLVSDDPRAQELRRHAVFFVYPNINPDGRYMLEKMLHITPPLISPTPTLRGSPEIYAAGQIDHNRVWATEGQFASIDIIKAAIRRDTGGIADYAWDFHGGRRERHDYRSGPRGMDSRYAGALKQREPTIPRRRGEGGQRSSITLTGWLASEEGLSVPHVFGYEPHQYMEKERIFEVGSSLALGFYDVVTGQAPRPEDVELPGPAPDPQFRHREVERALRVQAADY